MDTATWIQAIAAIAALLLSIITLLQQNKIKTLTDVVDQLRDQNEIAKQQFQLEKENSIKHSSCYLIISSHPIFMTTDPIKFSITNIGQLTSVMIFKSCKPASLSNSEYEGNPFSCPNGFTWGLNLVVPTHIKRNGFTAVTFEFKDSLGATMRQELHVTESGIELTPPSKFQEFYFSKK